MMRKYLVVMFLTVIALVGCQAEPTATEAAKPAIHVAYSSEPDLADIPSLMALDLLREQGYEVTETFFAEVPLAVEAVSRGDAQFSTGSTDPHWSAIQHGGSIVTIAEQVRNIWTLVSNNSIETCADMAGKRLSFSSEGSGSAALTRAYIAQNCPGTEPEIVLISGSSNRAAALLAGEIDITPLELSDAQVLLAESPNDFKMLVRFADALPDMVVTGVHANRDFATNNPQVVEDFLRALVTVHQQIADNPDALVQKAAEVLDEDAEELAPIIQVYIDFGAWATDGGLTEERANNGLAFFVESGELEAGLSASDVANWDYLEVALSDQ